MTSFKGNSEAITMINRLIAIFFVLLLSGTLFADNFSALTMFFYSTQALLIDHTGRKIGYVNKSGKIYEEIPGGTYTLCQPEEETPYYWLDVGEPDEGLYTLVITGTDNQLYNDQVDAINENNDRDKFHVSGIISKGEEQKYELIYSPHTYDKTTLRKIIDIDLMEREIKNAFRFKIINNKTFQQELHEQVKKAKRVKYDRSLFKDAMLGLMDTLQKERNRQEIVANQKKPSHPYPDQDNTQEDIIARKAWLVYNEWVRVNIEPIDILLIDANELAKEGHK